MLQPKSEKLMRLEVGDAVIWDLASDYIHKPISWVLVLGQLEAKTFKIR